MSTSGATAIPGTTATEPATTGATPSTAPRGAPYVAAGKVTRASDGKVVFVPVNTNYELELVAASYAGPLNKPVKGIVRVRARKVWTVPSGGNFITPLFGPPKIIQGRVRSLDKRTLVVQAGTAITVDLPDEDIVYDLANGAISEGVLVNVTAFPGATFELVK
jgi:hypothetical protein